MKKTEQYDLNQWDLTDRVRMEDFNADNLKIAAALAGLSGQIGALPSQDDLNAVKSGLEAADQQLESKLLRPYSFILSRAPSFQLSPDGSCYTMDTTGLGLTDYAVFFLSFQISDSKKDTYYINAIIDGGEIVPARYLSTKGASTQAMIPVPSGTKVSCFFFPLCFYGTGVGGIFLGTETGVGSATCIFSQLKGFQLTPASGSLDSKIKITVSMAGIK